LSGTHEKQKAQIYCGDALLLATELKCTRTLLKEKIYQVIKK
jgi:hypothetical protein